MTEKEIVFRQWYQENYPVDKHPDDTIADIERAYWKWYQAEFPSEKRVSFNFVMRKVRDIMSEIDATGSMVPPEDLNVTTHVSKHLQPMDDNPDAGRRVSDPKAEQQPYELVVETIDDMKFPKFDIYKTHTIFDRLWSDMDQDGGMYSGTVNIVTGESGVGKTTLLIDYLAKIRRNVLTDRGIDHTKRMGELLDSGVPREELFEPLFISSEMTRNDIYFFKEKMPIIGPVATFIASDHIRTRTLKQALEDIFFSDDYPIILLDSYKDIVEKLKDIYDWSTKYAENYVINLMVESAEKYGTTLLAVQHQTKGGQYAGSTYLKHTTTSMLELRFADGGTRFASFSKNRRGGSMTHIPIFFTIDKEKNECVYDEVKFNNFMKARNHSASAGAAESDRINQFESLFSMIKNETADDSHESEHEIDTIPSMSAEELRLPQPSKNVEERVLTPFTDRINAAANAERDIEDANIIDETDADDEQDS